MAKVINKHNFFSFLKEHITKLRTNSVTIRYINRVSSSIGLTSSLLRYSIRLSKGSLAVSGPFEVKLPFKIW